MATYSLKRKCFAVDWSMAEAARQRGIQRQKDLTAKMQAEANKKLGQMLPTPSLAAGTTPTIQAPLRDMGPLVPGGVPNAPINHKMTPGNPTPSPQPQAQPANPAPAAQPQAQPQTTTPQSNTPKPTKKGGSTMKNVAERNFQKGKNSATFGDALKNTWGKGGFSKNWKGRSALIGTGVAAAGTLGLAAKGAFGGNNKN